MHINSVLSTYFYIPKVRTFLLSDFQVFLSKRIYDYCFRNNFLKAGGYGVSNSINSFVTG